MQQLTLFPEEAVRPQPRRPKPTGGSSNPIVFHDYESYIAKFQGKEKTTDDTYTPKDVFEAVVQYVGEVYDLTGKEILRPFYPGGDYEHAEYPEDGVVIDNPPFSIFSKICAFYSARRIPFFIFGPGLTIASCCKYCTAVIVSASITFDNKAKVKCNFSSNLFGDTMIMTAPRLDDLLQACPSQNAKVNLPKYDYPEELLAVSDMQTICKGGIDFRISRKEAEIIHTLDNHPKKGRGDLFGDHFLISHKKGKKKEAARLRAQEAARLRAQEAARLRAQEAARNAIPVPLSPREQRIVERLGRQQHD